MVRQMIPQVTNDPRAWRAATLDPPATWYVPLSPTCRSLIDDAIRLSCSSNVAPTGITISDAQQAAVRDWSRAVTATLESGCGFVIVRDAVLSARSTRDQQVAYWVVARLLGMVVEQNVQGTVFYDVRDTGQDVRAGARFSVTNAESSFHTDNSFGADIVDYVGLLCLNPAKSGGLSQMVSGYAVVDEIRKRHPAALPTLSALFHVDRRGGVVAGELPTVRFPVLRQTPGGLEFRYLRYWIEAGHEKAHEPLSSEQRDALDCLDLVANDAALRAEFALAPGDMYFINNRWILHNRTAFEDFAEPDRRRHLVRLWLKSNTSS